MSNVLTVPEGQPVTALKWFMYNQNNSGGSFVIKPEEGIGETVWIQARSAGDANMRALGIGLYFDGRGDCSCCGDRWSEVWGSDEGTTREPYIWASWRRDDVYAHRYDGTFYQVTTHGELD
jgi:hypothetical protein